MQDRQQRVESSQELLEVNNANLEYFLTRLMSSLLCTTKPGLSSRSKIEETNNDLNDKWSKVLLNDAILLTCIKR